MKVSFNTKLQKFKEQGEKTGWTYILIPKETANKIKPQIKKSYRVKGSLDDHSVKFVAMIPFGEGDYIIAINAEMRKAIRKQAGAEVKVVLEEDTSEFELSADFMACLAEEHPAQEFFNSLLPSHQRYFSNWIESAKTEPTKVKRIAMAINALSRKWGYGEMIRASKAEK